MSDVLEILGGLDMSTATEVKRHDLNESEDISQELCTKVTEPTILDFDDDLCAEYESFYFYPLFLAPTHWFSVFLCD